MPNRSSAASQRWLQRHRRDQARRKAVALGFRSRAAIKLMDIDDKYNLLVNHCILLDLGCAPGGWLQVIQRRLGHKARILGVDQNPVDPIPGTTILQGDLEQQTTWDRIRNFSSSFSGVLSDCSPSASGQPNIDHLRSMALQEMIFTQLPACLAPNGWLLTKVLVGAELNLLRQQLQQQFAMINLVKPKSSNRQSREIYLLARGYRPSDGSNQSND